MKILGLSSNYHDASAAIVCDGKVVAAAAEERFTSQKHDPSFPSQSIQFCLRQAGLTAGDLDLVAYHEDPIAKFSRTLSSSFKNFPFSLATFIKSMREAITSGFWIKSEICKAVGVDLGKVEFVPHHLSHAAHAFLSSPFDESAIMTIDAVGEWSTTCLFAGRKSADGSYSIEPVDMVPFPHSLGLVYSAFTAFLGFKANDGECSTMALAAFGKPRYAQEVRKVIRPGADGKFEVDLSYFDFSRDDRLPVTEKFTAAFGSPRFFKDRIGFSSLLDRQEEDPDGEQQRFADVAASLQQVTEETVLGIARRLLDTTKSKNLCYAGGVALNCVANSKLAASKLFENIYIPPDPGDGGGAMGAALYASMLFDRPHFKRSPITPYLGEAYGGGGISQLLPLLKSESWHKFSKLNMSPLRTESLVYKEIGSERELLGLVARKIHENKIVGWMQGRFENGPRALGNRSILCRADSVATCSRLSSRVKQRADFRPYACSLTEPEASRVLEDYHPGSLSKWMQSSYRVRPEFVERLRGGLHVDRTTRAQVCTEDDNPLFYGLIDAYRAHSGVGALVNTSFNEKGYPIAASPVHGLLMFARTEMDVLVVDNLVVSKGPL